MARLCISLFGVYTITLDGTPLYGFDSDKSRLLLAYLAFNADRPERREHLAGLFWPEQPDVHARRSLSQALYNLRQLLGESRHTSKKTKKVPVPRADKFLLSDSLNVQFNPNCSYQLDTQYFSELLSTCKMHNHRFMDACPDCLKRLIKIKAIYRGSFLESMSLKNSVAFEEWAQVERVHFSHEALNALLILSRGYEYRGETPEAIEIARHIVELDPWWEAGQYQLIHLLACTGQASQAINLFERFKNLLANELATTPELNTQYLGTRLKQEASSRIELTHLPTPVFPLIGRKQELAELHCYLNLLDCRLLTILGPGGSGKSRLALELARAEQYSFRDGVYLISLSALDPHQSFDPVIAQALSYSYREQAEPHQQLMDFLSRKNLLLVMDSFEAVLSGRAWITEVLRSAPSVKFLVTSRASLNIRDEQIFALEGMPLPEAGELVQVEKNDAIELFLTFARHRQPGLILEEHSYHAIIRICRLLHGLPLGLLLASSWVESYSLEEIAQQIEQNLGFLEVDWTDIPLRQRSLEATFEYSWKMLSDEEQRFLTALVVFSGSFSITAIRRVAGNAAHLVQTLVNNSLIYRITADRYQIHDLIHRFVLEKLEQDQEWSKEVHNRHSRFYLDALKVWGRELKGLRQREALDAMNREVENMRAAWRWAVSVKDWEGIANGLEGMGWYADLCFRFEEGERACRSALQTLPSQTHSQLYSALVTWRAHFLHKMNQVENSWQLLRSELIRLDELQEQGYDIRAEKAQVLYELGELHLFTDRIIARGYYQQCLELFKEIKDDENTGKTLLLLGEVIHHAGEYALAETLLSNALPLVQATGEPRRLADNLRWLGFNYIRQGRIDEGEPHIRRAIEVRKQIGDRSGEAQSLDDYGTILAWRGRYTEGLEMLEQCLPIYEELGIHAKVAWILALLGLLNDPIRRYDRARQEGFRCIQYCQQMNYPRELALGYSNLGQADLGEEKYPDAYQHLLKAIEVERSISQSDEMAFVLGNLALAELYLGQIESARQHLYEALSINKKTHGMFSANVCLSVASVMLAVMSQVEKAIEIESMMLRYPAISNSSWYEDTCWSYVKSKSIALLPEDEEKAQKRGKLRDLNMTVEELLNEFSAQPKDNNQA